MKDGRVAYRLKTPRRGSTHRVMTPVELLARLAILVPPPYFPLVRYHGVFAARSSWRALVTLKAPKPKRPKRCASAGDQEKTIHAKQERAHALPSSEALAIAI